MMKVNHADLTMPTINPNASPNTIRNSSPKAKLNGATLPNVTQVIVVVKMARVWSPR
jgi:hypothetical protein